MLDFSANAFTLKDRGSFNIDSQTREIEFTGNASILVDDDPAFTVGTQEFCFELPPLKLSSLSGARNLMGQYDFGTTQRAWRLIYNTELRFQWSTDGDTPTSTLTGPTLSTGTEYMIAVERDDSNVIRLYVDGAVEASVTSSDSIHNSTAAFAIGAELSSGSPQGFFEGTMRGLPRLLIGAHRYGGAYTPPTMPWPTQ